MQSKLEQPGADLNALAKQFNLQTGEAARFVRGAGGPPLGVAQPLQEMVFGDSPLGIGHLGGPVLLGDDRLVIVKVLEHRKPQVKPLAEVRDGIVAVMRKQRGTDAALEAAQAARAKLEAGTSFDDVARELGVPADPARFIGRGDPSVPAQLRETVFAAPKPGDKPVYRAVKLETGGAALVAITKLRSFSTRSLWVSQAFSSRVTSSSVTRNGGYSGFAATGVHRSAPTSNRSFCTRCNKVVTSAATRPWTTPSTARRCRSPCAESLWIGAASSVHLESRWTKLPSYEIGTAIPL